MNFTKKLIWLSLTVALVLKISAFTSETEAQPETSIFELISMTDQLSVLHELVETAGLSETLNEEAPITAFLPVNEAFNSLPEGLLEYYTEDEEALRHLLMHHIFEGEILSRNLEDGQVIEMMSGETVEISVSGVGLELDEATIIQVDVDASNGIIHVVNHVNIPEN